MMWPRSWTLIAAALSAGCSGVELTKEDWDEKTEGKSVFVKFLAPWCGHCKRMKPDWDSLMSEFEESKTVLIADVDCTAGGKELCQEVGVQGYPTIKYGDPDSLENYDGERELGALREFVTKSLGPKCGPSTLHMCDEAEKRKIQDFMEMPLGELKQQISEKEEEIAKIDADLKALLEKLQGQYKEEQESRDARTKAIKDEGLSLMKSVQAHHRLAKQQQEKKDEL